MPRPPSIHYTRQQPARFDERHLERIARYRRLQDWFGAAPICFVARCRRTGRCSGDPQKGRFYLPPCVGHYREEFRFLVLAPGGVRARMIAAGRWPRPSGAAAPDEAPGSAPAAAPPQALPTVIGWFYGTDAQVLRRLRRAAHMRSPGGWETDPEGFARYMAEGDWRNPEQVCRREPAPMHGRWVE